MADLFLLAAVAEFAIGALLVVRIGAGPSVSDRVVALNAFSTQATLSLLFFSAFGAHTGGRFRAGRSA